MRREATGRFVRAALGGDIAELMEVLAPDVTAWSDAGCKRRPASLRPVHGRDKVARLITNGRGGPGRPVWRPRGRPGAGHLRRGQPGQAGARAPGDGLSTGGEEVPASVARPLRTGDGRTPGRSG
ncbi:hypothetical protein GCM10023086_51100 [Streptomyces venetus]|uniref:SnoaL-like domain-containing protein n=1 Tax=Streptomyces venetus TaxID=1701086 RepID=A0ABP8GHP7_9ACTN